ncbi:MAG: phosphatidate cytidylyltransferase [Anderseniella sp.]|nr:phosphatidate cytidylyltransferase [Anderseniella sp.]
MSPSTDKPAGRFVTRELAVRIAAALVLIPIALLDVWAGSVWFELGIAMIAAIMAAEWCRMVHRGSQFQFVLHALAAIAAVLIVSRSGVAMALQVIAVCWMMSLIREVLRKKSGSRWAWWGIPYIALPGLALILIRQSPEYGLFAVLWLFAVVWSADTLAYVFGRLIGGPKLAPSISPNKTWAGLVGAVAGGIVASAAMGWYAGLPSAWPLLVGGGVLAVLEQLGDLFESAAKRRFGVKDSGRIIPGHGGVLDRVDGLIFASVAAAAFGYARGGHEAVASGLVVW